MNAPPQEALKLAGFCQSLTYAGISSPQCLGYRVTGSQGNRVTGEQGYRGTLAARCLGDSVPRTFFFLRK